MSNSGSNLSGSAISEAFMMTTAPPPGIPGVGFDMTTFYKSLMDNMRDGAVFVDARGHIKAWSQAVEIMTGMSRGNVTDLLMAPSLLHLSDDKGNEIDDARCPLQESLRTGKKSSGEYIIVGRSGRETKVELTFAPIKLNDGTIQGAVVLVHDSSVQLDLKRQLRDLYEFSMLDPLTQVANRAEFERVLDQFVQTKNNTDFRSSLIICDIDFFKSINDNYNHHIGDQALVSFASLLKKFVRANDIVARYGGEEFVILCANCDRESAVQRAEEIRVTLTKTPQQMLDGKCITASFGVAELQSTDSAVDFFVRADTALLKAKELGRNRVVEADTGPNGDGTEMISTETNSAAGVQWRNFKHQSLICEEFKTATPISVLVEKLRGFIVETEAEIRRVEPDFATMQMQVEDQNQSWRKGNFVIDIEFQELEVAEDKTIFVGNRSTTFIRITIREGKKKWFAVNANELASVIMNDLRRYLMIHDESSRVTINPAATESGR